MANNVTVDFTTNVCTTDPLGAGLVITEFGGWPAPIVGNTTWRTNLANLAPGHCRCSIAWYNGNPGYGAGGSGVNGQRTPGGATALINAIKGIGAIPLVSFNGDGSDNHFNPADGGSLVHYFNDNGGQNGGPIHYWSIGNEVDDAGDPNVPAYKSASGTGSAPATLAAMLAASPGINVGAPAAAYWDPSLLQWAAGNLPGLGCLSYHAYDGVSNFPNDGEYYTHIHTDVPAMKSGVLYGLEECNWNPAYNGDGRFYDWHNAVFIADATGQVLSAGGHMTIYGDSNGALGVMNDGTNNNNQPGGFATTFPAYWGLGIWTGMNGQFFRYSGHMVSATTTFGEGVVTVFASDNGKIVVVNKSGSNQTLSIALTLKAGVTAGSYNVWATNASSPLSPISKVVSAAPFSGSVINYVIPAQTAVSIDVTPGGSSGNTVTVTNPGSQSATVGTVISPLQIHATDNATGQTLTYTVSGLPPGLSISSSTGLITGTPTTTGTYSVTVAVTDTTSASGSTVFSWTVSPSGGPGSQPNGIPGSWTLVFDDEFTGTTLNTNNWTVETSTGNNVTFSGSNVIMQNPGLALQVASATSGAQLISTNYSLPVGSCCEARVWFPGPGAPTPGNTIYNWPAWWVSGPNWPNAGEIDIAESYNGTLTNNYHSPSGAHNGPSPGPSGNWSNSWHTYGMLRTATSFNIYFDGVLVYTYSPTDDNGAAQSLLLTAGSGNTAAYGTSSYVKVSYVRAWAPSGGGNSGTLNGQSGPQTVALGAYTLQVNEWNSAATEQLSYSYPPPAFTVTGSAINNATNNAPGAYPSIYNGNHFGTSSASSPFPLAVSSITAGQVTSSVTGTLIGSGNWDFAYDIWFCPTGTFNGTNKQELMIWLNHLGSIQPAGAAGATVTLAGIAWTRWSSGAGNTVSYVANTGMTSVTNLDIYPFIQDMISQGIMPNTWVLLDIECGFEIWTGGVGLAINSFSVSGNGGGGGNTVTVSNPGSQTGTQSTAITSLQINATDSAVGQTLTYSASGLPAGLSISSTTGLISGTPTTVATYSVTVTATDTTSAAGSTSFSWQIYAPGPPPTSTTLINNFNNTGATGAAITTGNSGGGGQNAFDVVTTTNSATAVYSAAQAIHSPLSGAFSTGTVSGVSQVQWTTSLGSQSIIYGRVYVYLTGYPTGTADEDIVAFSTSGTFGGGIMVATSGQLRTQNASFGEVGGGPTLPLNQWFRLEWKLVCGAAGAASLNVNYYASADSATVSNTVTDAAGQFGTGGVINGVGYGWPTTGVSEPVMYMGALNVNTTGYPGAVSNNVLLVNNVESGTLQATVTVANSGSAVSNAFDGVTTIPAAPHALPSYFPEFPNLSSLLLETEPGAPATACNVFWSTSMGTQTIVYGRVYIQLGAFPAADDTVVQFTSSGTFGGGVIITAGGALGVQSAGGVKFFNGITLPVNQGFFRVEWKVVCGAAGSASCTVNYYANPDDTIIAATVTDTTGQYGVGGSINKVAFGWNTPNVGQPPLSMGFFGVSSMGYLGPGNHPSTGSVALSPFMESSSGSDANTLLYNTFEGGTNTTTITTANSGGASGHVWDVASVTNGSLTFSTTQAAHGSFAAAMSTNATGGVAYLGWTTSLGIVPQLYGRFNIYLTAYPAAVDANIQMKGTLGSSAGNIQIDLTGHLVAQTPAFATAFTFTNAIPLNTWVRVEWYILVGAAGIGQLTVNYYATLDSTVITESHTDTANAWGGVGGSPLNANPYFAGGSSTGWATGGGGPATFSVTGSAPAGSGQPYAGELTDAVGTTYSNMTEYNQPFNITPGAQYQVTAMVYSSTGNANIGLNWQNGATFVSSSNAGFTITANTWTLVTAAFAAPATGVTQASPFVTVNVFSGAYTIYATSIVAAAFNTGIAEVDFGWTNTHISQPTIYMDDLAVSPATFLGPAGIPVTGSIALQPFAESGAAFDNTSSPGAGSVALQPFTFSGRGNTNHVPVINNFVSGNVVNDYGLDNVFFTVNTPGLSTGLVAFIGWDIAQSTASTSGKGPAVNVTDSAGNLWRQVAITQVSGTSRAAIWFCDNPRQVQWVSVAVTGWVYSTSYTIAEIDNLPSGFQAVSLDFVQVAHSDIAVTSLTVPAGTVSSSDICFAVLSTGGNGGALTVPTGWSGIAAAGGGLSAQATTYSMYIPTQGAGSVSFTPTWATPQPVSGVIIGLKLNAAAPVQVNPNFPVVVVEAAFGATPGDFTQSVDYTWAGSTGWSFTTSGTPANNSYFIVTTAQAASISVGQQFYDSNNSASVFTVTNVGAPFAGFVNVSFTPNAGTVMSSPDTVYQTVTWTDISSRVISDGTEGKIRVTRGRQYELSQEETGEITLTLDNHDGAFTYGNTNSPYYPDCVPGVPIRVTAWFNGVQYPVAFGYVERWPQEWPDLPQWGFSIVVATDVYGALAGTSLPSAVEGEARKDGAYAYFPCDEQYSFTTQSLDPIKVPVDANGLLAVNKAFGNNRYGAYRDGFDQAVTTGQALNLLGDSDTAMGAASYTAPETQDNGPGMFYFDPNIPTNASGKGVTFEFWFTWGNGTLAANTFFSAWGPPSSFYGTSTVNGGVISVGVNIGSNAAKATGFFVNGVEIASGNSTWNQNNFAPQHFALTSLNSVNLTYLNGVSRSIGTAVPSLPSVRALTLGPARFAYDVSDLVVYNGFNYTAGHLAVYPYTLTAQQVQNHYTAGIYGAGYIPAPGRFAQALTWGLLGLKRGGTAWYGSYGNVENTFMAEAYDFEGSTGADIMSRLVQSEGGRCFTQGNGSLVYVMRWSSYNQVPVVTFGDNGTTELPFLKESSFSVDNSFINNTIQVTQNRGPDQVFTYLQTDRTSQLDYFQRSGLQIQSYALTPFDVFDSGNWLMAKYKQPSQRVQQLSLDVAGSQVKNPSMFPTVLSLELEKIVTVNRRPVGGAVLGVTGAIQQIQHDIGPVVWKTKYQVAPVLPESQALIADVTGQNTPGTQYLSW